MDKMAIVKSVIGDFFNEFGTSQPGFIFMWIIVVVAALALAVLAERVYVVVIRSKINVSRFMTELIKLIRAKDFDKAIALCDSAPEGALSRMAKAGLREVDRGVRQVQYAMDEACLSIIPEIEKRTPYLFVFSNVATLSGLMGTIFGLMFTFKAIAVLPVAQQSQALASGISAAMNTTIFGLIVAIPIVLAYQWILSQSKQVIDDLDEQSVRLINTIREL
ncbi:MAG: MotA/TolQ/ExbB proton channel family protein [Candidatus Latescibacterota bacterium]|nr:MotA/TolQ/ExbB proton channel family protein [Candidatus Latescibacterota bacterium]OPX25811.1 MAG: hypothetical protein B1H02_00445 [Candidatus Latescibacteria bacterium 4484_107]RKY71854.1 MAG: MotA/TolQ/ExbB proton channel family protein [Candidatus Latescibacterota bacterium]